MRDELLNEALFFGLEHAHHAIAEWTEDYNRAGRIRRSTTRHRRPLPPNSPQQAITLRSVMAPRAGLVAHAAREGIIMLGL
jgi:Integrase core domain